MITAGQNNTVHHATAEREILAVDIFNRTKVVLIKDALNQSKVTVKTFIMLQKIPISNKCCSFELSIHL